MGEGVRRKEVGRGRRGQEGGEIQRKGRGTEVNQGVEEKPVGPGLGCGFREG